MAFSIDPRTSPGIVALTVRELEPAAEFYQSIAGFRRLSGEEQIVILGAGDTPILKLVEDTAAAPPPPRSAGLYHFAVLFPSRPALGALLRHLAETRWPLQGFADHAVSEAIYLADPEGNGIELYRDLPRESWPYLSGKLQMTTDPLDIESILAEAGPQPETGARNGYQAPEGTRLGHMHLRVTDIEAALDFYTRGLGFDLITRYGPSAGFVSAGGYHHHIGFNIWNSAGGPTPPEGSLGLRYFTLKLPDDAALENLAGHLQQEGIDAQEVQGGLQARDPSGNKIIFTVRDMI